MEYVQKKRKVTGNGYEEAQEKQAKSQGKITFKLLITIPSFSGS